MKSDEIDMEYVFDKTFGSKEGRTMLYWILSECGYFSDNPGFIRPELVALANRLLAAGGVTHPARAGRYIENLLVTASAPVEERSDDDEDLEP